MKTFFYRNKIWIGILVLMFILNVSILGTIYIINKRNRDLSADQEMPLPSFQQREGIYLRDELRLNDEQFLRFRDVRDGYQRSAAGIEREILNRKASLFREMTRPEPNHRIIESTNLEIGQLYTRLLGETSDYYTEIRTLCTEEQKIMLDRFFMRVLLNESTNEPPERNQRRRPGRPTNNNRPNR